MINSPELSHSLINQNKRYIRFSKWASHPSWLGWTDHSLFPPGEEIPSFFYIRKFNVLGNVFQEEKLMDWIGEFHYNNATKNCTIEDISVNKFCLRALASSITNDNHIIIAPVNRPYLVAAANLGCSLKSLEKNNIIFWSLDLSIHQALLSVGRLTIFLPGFPNIADKFQPGDQSYYSLLRYKPIIMRYILEAGFDLTFIDTDSIITSDFFGFLPRNVDIFFSGAYLKKDHDKLEISSSFIHFRTNNQTINFIKDLETAIEFYPSKSLEWIIAGLVQHVNVHGPDGFGIVFPDFSRALHFSNHSNYLKDLSIGILDPKNHIDWQSDLFSNQEANFENVRLIRYGKSKIVQSILKNAGLWYVSDSGKCFTK